MQVSLDEDPHFGYGEWVTQLCEDWVLAFMALNADLSLVDDLGISCFGLQCESPFSLKNFAVNKILGSKCDSAFETFEIWFRSAF